MNKRFFTFLFVFNIFGACTLFPVQSTGSAALIDIKKTIRLAYIEKKVVQKKFPWIDDHLYSIIEKESAKYDEISPMIVASLIWKESRGDQYAKSRVGAIGYMQVMPFHYRGHKSKLFDPEINIREGVEELANCYKRKRFSSDIGALKCYNAGPNHKEYTNWKYVQEITKNYNELSEKVMDKVLVYTENGYEVI